MTDTAQIPFLLRLVDDDSESVRTKVVRELRSFGPQLQREIDRLGIDLTAQQAAIVQEILELDETAAFRRTWQSWLQMKDPIRKLETANKLIVEWQLGAEFADKLSPLLDALAEECVEKYPVVSAESLSQFLFRDKRMGGPEAQDHYNPLNTNLVYVIEARRGIQISLACVYILVGRRLSLDVSGCNFPGHFLARARVDGEDLIVDCFNGGRIYLPDEAAALAKAAPHELATVAPTEVIIARLLNNLVSAYYESGDHEKTRFVLSLIADIEKATGR